ncbi:polysaccharide pyruvyl transferase family protein [Anaerosporobacter sp.]
MRDKNFVTRLNIGDPIQTLAMKYLYQEMGIKGDLVEISRYHAKDYQGDNVILPFQCFNRIYNQFGHPYGTLPVSEAIHPIFFSFHLHSRALDHDIIQQFKKYQPIGCRDEETKLNMERNGIEAYLTGCVTALLPKRINVPKRKKVFFIDVPNSLKPHIPAELLQEAEFLEHHIVFERLSDDPIMTEDEYNEFYRIAKERLKRYADEATLIVTSRLHAASPCMAMGIPVIMVSDNWDGRFSWLEKYLPLYLPSDFHKINWNPQPVEYEEEKKVIINLLKNALLQNKVERDSWLEVDQYYCDRDRIKYNRTIIEELETLPIWNKRNIKFGIWGLNTLAQTIKNVILDQKKDWKFVAAIDKSSNGFFEGVKVSKPQQIPDLDSDIVYLVIPKNAHDEAESLFKKNHQEVIYFSNYRFNYCKY